MLSLLRDQLCVLCAPLESPGKKLTNQMIADIGESPTALEEVFQCLNDSVYQLGEAISKGVELKEVSIHVAGNFCWCRNFLMNYLYS